MRSIASMPRDAKELKKRAQIAWGLALICLLFLLETWNADRLLPNKASPLIWTVLALAALVLAAAALWFGHRARRAFREAVRETVRETDREVDRQADRAAS
jgi:peptidoglycan/LPS O-acetylase OafA/YrhL